MTEPADTADTRGPVDHPDSSDAHRPADTGSQTERPGPTPGVSHRRRRAARRRPGHRRQAVVLAVVAVVAAAVLVVSLVDLASRPATTPARTSDGPTSTTSAVLAEPSAVEGFLSGATVDLAAVTTFGYSTLSSDAASGASVTTGSYRSAYRAAIDGAFGRQVRALRRTQGFEQAAIGIGAMSADGRRATVLVFGTQTVTDLEPRRSTSSMPITLTATVVRAGSRYLISTLAEDENAGLPGGSPALDDAAEAARAEVAAMLTFRRASFAADLRAAQDLAVGPQRSALTAHASAVRAELTRGGYDLAGSVTAVAVASAAGSTVMMLVAATGTRSGRGGTQVVTEGRYVVTVVRLGTGWFVSQVQSVGGA